MRKVLLAKSAGFCFGVRRAVKLAQEIAESGAPYVMLGPVIHNDHVIAQLAAQGVGCVSSLEEVPPGCGVIIRSHGETRQVLERLEAMGSVSPATYLDAKYKQTTTFPDVISIQVTLTQFTGVRLRLHYVMTKEGGPVVFEGNSEHCFQDQQGHILRLRKAFPAFAQALDQQLAAGQEA